MSSGGAELSEKEKRLGNSENYPSTSRAVESLSEALPKAQGADAEGESKRVGALLLKHPRHLYRFANVGAVMAFARVGALHIVVDTEHGDMPVEIPQGNWILIGVGAMDCLDVSGFVTYNAPTQDAGANKE